MKYQHLRVWEREIIQEMLWNKESVRAIAKRLERSPSSISREINKNIPLQRSYRPRIANEKAFKKRKNRGRKLRLKNGFIRRYVVDSLKNGYSPEQISGRLTLEHPNESVSHEAIYQYVYSQVYRNGYGYIRPGYHDLRRYLKRRHKRRARKGMRKGQRIFRPYGLSIEERPLEVATRKTVGHWEGDSVVSSKNTVGLNTLVERKTGLAFITKIQNSTTKETINVVVQRLGVLPNTFRRTLTVDNGSENTGHDIIKRKLSTICYYAHPYSSWERGTNENTNGLIRWYFPKGTDFAKVTDEEIANVEYALNSRPRKRLGWRTPLEVFNSSVALTH